jgi:hypothetical protein
MAAHSACNAMNRSLDIAGALALAVRRLSSTSQVCAVGYKSGEESARAGCCCWRSRRLWSVVLVRPNIVLLEYGPGSEHLAGRAAAQCPEHTSKLSCCLAVTSWLLLVLLMAFHTMMLLPVWGGASSTKVCW